MKKINDNFYINLNTVCVMQFTNGKYIASLSNGKQLNLTADSYNVLAEEFVDYKINDNLYINPNNISAICYANGRYTTYLSNGNNIGIDVTAFDILKVKLESCKVNDNLYVNPQYIIDTTVLQHPSNEDYIITLNNGVKLEVTADAYSSIAEMEAEGFGGKVLINNSKTVVPNSGYLNEVYFNTSLSIEEVIEQLSKLNYVAVDGGYSVYGLFATKSGFHCLTVMAREGVYLIFDISTDEVYFSSIDMSETQPAGWSQLASSPMIINEEITNNLNGITSGDQNDVLKDLIYIPGTIVELEGEYDGDSISVTENGIFDIQDLIQNNNQIPLKVNVDVQSPTFNIFDKCALNVNTKEVYVDTSLSVDEVDNILSSLTYIHDVTTTDGEYYYTFIVVNNDVQENGFKYVLRIDKTTYKSSPTVYKIIFANSDSGFELYSTTNGFNQEVNYPFSFDLSNAMLMQESLENIKSIIYSLDSEVLTGDYEYEDLSVTENGTIDLKDKFLNEKKIVSSIDVDVKVKLLGGVGCTTIPTSGTVENLYFNTNLSIEKVQNLLEQIEFQTYIYLYFFAKNTDGKGYYVWYNKTGDKTWYIRNSDGLILYQYNASKTFTDFNGWNPDVTYPITVNYELEDVYTGKDMIGVTREYKVGYDNERLKILASTSPFEELEDNILSGEYEKEKISITENGSVDLLSHITDENKIPVEVEVIVPLPEGEIEITENGTYDVEQYKSANINIGSTSNEDMLQKIVNLTNSLAYMFQNYAGTGEELSFMENLDTTNLKIMNNLYAYCFNLTSYPNVDTRNVMNFSEMFYDCTSLKKIILDTTSATFLTQAFYECIALQTLDISYFNMNNTYATVSMCENCKSLTSIIIRGFGDSYMLDSTALSNCYHFTGEVADEYNPNGDKDGYFYVPSSMVDTLKADESWSTYADQIRALEDYTVDGTTTGELDESKI